MRSFRFPFYIVVIGLLAMMTGAAFTFGNVLAVIVCIALFFSAVILMARSENAPDVYPSDVPVRIVPPEQTDTPAPMPNGTDVAHEQKWLPLNAPVVPTAAMVITNSLITDEQARVSN